MTQFKATPALLAALGIAAMAAAGFAAQAQSGQAEAGDGAPCRILTTREGNLLHLAATFDAPGNMAGHYALTVVGKGSAGSSRISQGNAFRAQAGEALTLGSVSLSSGKVYEARLVVQSDAGETWRCSENFGF